MIMNRFMNTILSTGIFAAVLLGGMETSNAKVGRAGFKDQIFPILETYCLDCHQPGGSGYEKSGLDMTTYESLMKGTKFGPMVIPGDAFASNLMVLIEGRANKKKKCRTAVIGRNRPEMTDASCGSGSTTAPGILPPFGIRFFRFWKCIVSNVTHRAVSATRPTAST